MKDGFDCEDKMNIELVSTDERRFTRDIPPVNRYGRPTTFLSYLMLNHMFSYSNRSFTADELTAAFVAWQPDVDMICRQLAELDFITEIESEPPRYMYNKYCENADLQAGFEKFLIDVKQELLSVHRMLDYAPSYRRRSI